MRTERTREVRNGRLWFASLGSAVAWALHLTLCYPLVGVTCRAGSLAAIIGVSVATGVLCLAAIIGVSVATGVLCLAATGVGVYERRRLEGGEETVELGRALFMARASFWLGLLFFVVIVAETLPVLFHNPCLDFRQAREGLGRGAGWLVGLLFPTAWAHVPRGPLRPEDVLTSWSPDPFLAVALLVGAGGYARGLRTLWRRAGTGRGVSRGQATAFAAGLLALALALLSPLDTVGAVLFSAHMLQHMALILLAAPLLVLGLPGYTLLWALPPRTRRLLARLWHARGLRAVLRVASAPLVVLLLHALAIWVWHLPSLYTAALEDEWVHILEHASFLGTALLFWWRVRASAGSGAPLLYVFFIAMQGGLLGVLITIAPTVWYPVQALGAPGWGLTALEDQQLAGLLMWVPGGVVYMGTALTLAFAWLGAAERRTRRREGAPHPEASLPADARRPSGTGVLPLVPLVLLALPGAGCREGAASEPVPRAATAPRLEGPGSEGLYRFHLELRPASPAVGELFEVRTTLLDARTSRPVRGARVVLDATMPEHAHGMVTAPEHTELGEGHYLSRGMKLHMPGRWRFHVRAEHEGRADERAWDYEQPPRALP